MDLPLQRENTKGENVPKQKKFPIKRLKNKKNIEKNRKEGIKNQIMDIKKIEIYFNGYDKRFDS
jgi:hypothetical protein